MHLQKKAIVIVNSYSTGKYYAAAFLGHGYQCIHVDTNAELPSEILASAGLDLRCFSENIILQNNDLKTVINKLKKYEVKAVIAGWEPGVNVADAIAAHFSVLKNDVVSTGARRNKFLMIDALAKHKVPCAQQYRAGNVNDLIKWYKNSGFKKVILKPTMAMLSDSVCICETSDDITRGFNRAYKKINVSGQVNDEFVIQEYLEGDEYIVNSVSCEGQHFITDIWLGVGGVKNTISTDEYAELISKNSPEFVILAQYIKKVLDAVGVRNGAAHSEVKFTEQGPKLIEIGARLAGGVDFSIVHEALGYSQISVSVETILNPELFATRIATYQKLPQKHLRFVYFCSEIEGKVLRQPDFSLMLKLDSMESIKYSLNEGDYLYKTNEVVGRPGYAFMLADDPNKLEQDYKEFRKLERKLYHDITRK